MEDYNNKPPFSETSLDFTKSTAKISLKSGSSWVFGYDDFTIESWVYCRDLEEFGNYLNDKTIFGSMTASHHKQQFLFFILGTMVNLRFGMVRTQLVVVNYLIIHGIMSH